MTAEGLIFDIQSFSVHDGPGCRTTVFLQGCPLQCRWCANPEGMAAKPHLIWREGRCGGPTQDCRRCQAACPAGAVTFNAAGQPVFDRLVCKACDRFACTAACLKEAAVVCGRRISVDELLRLLQRDRRFWGPGGGVTFSGGEPLLQSEFLLAALAACQASYIHTAIETTAYAPTERFLAVMAAVDFAFIDYKHPDSERHRAATGVGNELICANLQALKASGWGGRLVVRLPLIPGFNDAPPELAATCAMLQQLGWQEINLLPFHPLGASKWQQCGRVYPYAATPAYDETALAAAGAVCRAAGMTCYLGADTPF